MCKYNILRSTRNRFITIYTLDVLNYTSSKTNEIFHGTDIYMDLENEFVKCIAQEFRDMFQAFCWNRSFLNKDNQKNYG